MKFIFDFDDVLFDTTTQFKEHMYKSLEKAGVPRSVAEEYYNGVQTNKLWLRELLAHFSIKEESVYEKILDESKNFINKKLLSLIKKLGKANCYIVTYGNNEFQRDKIKRAGIDSFFREVIVVPESKKGAIEKICDLHKNEEVVFIDDKAKYFSNLDFVKYPNLKTILYDEHGLQKLKSILPQL